MEQTDFYDIKTVVISAVIVLNITLNSLVIAVIVRHPQLREDRTTLFMLSLTLSDLANGCTAMPISAALCSSATPDVRTMTRFLPSIQEFWSVWSNLVSMHSLCWVTVCKMVAITKPLRYEQILTRKRCYLIICSTWLGGAIFASMLISGSTVWNLDTCMYHLDIEGSTYVASALFFGVTVGILMPVVVIVYATTRIFFVIVRTHLEITTQVNSIGGEVGAVATTPNLTLKSIRSGRNVLLICLAYVILTIPITVSIIASVLGKSNNLPALYTFICVWILMCNSSANSLIYLILFRSVRIKTAAMISVFCIKMKCW